MLYNVEVQKQNLLQDLRRYSHLKTDFFTIFTLLTTLTAYSSCVSHFPDISDPFFSRMDYALEFGPMKRDLFLKAKKRCIPDLRVQKQVFPDFEGL